MFLLISFVLANNYCVGNSYDECKNKCQSFTNNFTSFYNKIPTIKELNTSNDAIHNIYISSDVDYIDTNYTLIFCDTSINLTYRNPKTIKIKDHIYADSQKIPDDVSIIFYFSHYEQYLSIEVETDEESRIKPFTLENYYGILYITTKFFTEYFPENLITLSKQSSYDLRISEITSNVEKLFSNPDKLITYTFTYYCLSDKENKCVNYANYSLKFINHTSQANKYPCFLIIESTKPQVVITNPNTNYFTSKEYVHIIAASGTDITYTPRYSIDEGEFYVVLHPNSIEMYDMYFEGEGKFTLSVNANISLIATTKTNNNNFVLKNRIPFEKSESYIYALRDDLCFDFENKIQVDKYSLFHGPKCLSGLFETERFLPDDEFIVYNVTADTLKETNFKYVTYYFKEGDHEIPKTWKSSCRFQGINPNKTNFIFNDVYSYDGYKIDNFIDVNFKPSSNLNRITIKPAKYFYLSSFNDIYHPKYIEKYTIIVENDFIMHGNGPSSSYDDDEISLDQCKIIGNGTIRFPNSYFMNQVKKFCQIDENVTLEPLIESTPTVYICLGQSNEEKCKSEIDGFESLQNYEWVWIRNIKTRSYLYNYNSNVYVTGKQMFLDERYYNMILTPNSSVIIDYYYYGYHYNDLYVYKNGINFLYPQRNSTKLIVLYRSHTSPHYDYRQTFRIHYKEAPTEIDFQVYFHCEMATLYMIYYKNYTEHCIQLTGECQIYIREQYQSIMNIFKCSDLINFLINHNNDYLQICLSNEPVESSSLYDFVLCSNSEEFKYYNSVSTVYYPSAFIYLNLSLDFNSTSYRCKNFFFLNTNLTVSIDLPNDALLIFAESYFDIICNNQYYLNFNSKEITFYFDIKDNITLDCLKIPKDRPKVEFTSSLDSVEIFPSPTIKNLIQYYTIVVPKNYTIYSPVPEYLNGLFGSTPINYSKNWSYYHYSNEGKLLYQSCPSVLFADFEKDDDLPENIVLAVGKDDNITIPSNWTSVHNFYILQNGGLLINKPTNLTYNLRGLVLNHKFNIIVGKLKITVPEIFTVNSYIPSSNYISHYFYSSDLNCSENSKTKLYTGSMNTNGAIGDGHRLVSIYGYGYPNDLTIISKSSDEQYDLKQIMYLYTDYNVKYRFDYDTICYCTDYDYNSKCPGKYIRANGITSLLDAIQDYPELTIWVLNDLDIPYPTGDHFVLNPKDENVHITVPDFPKTMITTENETLQFNYSDSTFIEIINKSYVDVLLKDYLSIYIESNTNTSITFFLTSDVFVSLESKIEANFSISVEKNLHNFYTEDVNIYNNIFNGSLESYIRVCAYDFDAASSCTYSRNETIDAVFADPFTYNVVEIALSSTPHEIRLPTIHNQINVNILPVPSSSLTIFIAENVQITPDSVIINDQWIFEGDRKVLNIKLESSSTLSVIEEMTVPIILQLTNKKSFIDLRDFDEQNSSLITILKTEDEINEITVFGNNDNYENFINCIKEHDNITIIHNGTQKYLCICTKYEECLTCKEGIDGLVTATKTVTSDPGEDVKIRVFSDYEITSNMFNNEHDVFIDSNCTLNLTYVNTVNQNIEEGLNVDNLHFVNGSNLLLKPRDIDLNIIMREEEMGPYFTIEMDTFLRLNVTNAENENIKSSRLHVNGFGELNSYDYPFDRIRPVKTVKVIKGVYIICNTRAGKDVCSYESAHRYKRLGHYDLFRPDFDPNSKILVFLDSYTSNIKVRTCILHNQRIQFVRAPSNSRRLLEGQNRLLFESNSEILNTENSTELFDDEGGTSLDNADSDLFVVCFNDTIKIRQEGNISANAKPISIQPMSNQATIILDDSVDIEKQKLKIESENDQPVAITILTNKNVTSEEMENFLDLDKEKISISLGGQIPTPKTKSKNGLSIGVIAGIVVGSVVFVALIVVIILFVVKKNKKENTALSENNMELSDSTF